MRRVLSRHFTRSKRAGFVGVRSWPGLIAFDWGGSTPRGVNEPEEEAL